MKRILLLLLVVPIIATAQTKKTSAKVSQKEIARANIKKWFKIDYVDTHFKDPYSYKLMKLELTPYTKKDELENEIRELKGQNGNVASENTELIPIYEKMLKTGSASYLNAYEKYYVELDAYGKNGMGNLILGKYRFLVDKKGKLLGDIININEN